MHIDTITQTLRDIATNLTDEPNYRVNVNYDNQAWNANATQTIYAQFAWLTLPSEAPATLWSEVKFGHQYDTFGAEWAQYAEKGGHRIMSPIIVLPLDETEATKALENAYAAFKTQVAEAKNEEADEIRHQLADRVTQTRRVYLAALAEYRALVDEDGEREHTNEEAQALAAEAARIGDINSTTPCVYFAGDKLIGWDWDPRSTETDAWDVITVELPFTLPA